MKKKLFPMALAICLSLALTQARYAAAEDNHIDTIRPDAPELAQYGSLAIGVKTLQLVHAGQLDILKAKPGDAIPTYDRPLTVEVWYPASLPDGQAGAGHYSTYLRDGKTPITLAGKAVRDAPPDTAHGPYPLLIVSHGYPGNRFLLSHLTENLASKGYVVVAIDHTDSTYNDQGAFASTLLNRPLDQLFVLNEMARLNASAAGGNLKGLINADVTGLIGYSMGGYGVVNVIGGGFTEKSVKAPTGVPNGALALRQSGNANYLASQDKRIKAAVAFAPWGWNFGVWDAAGLAAIRTPVFFVAGSVDDVSGYSPGVRNIFEASVNAPRFLLTFENANHNAGAPMPPPKEAWLPAPAMKRSPAEHYMDAVWDNTRMNNIAQHFVTAFLGKYLKNDKAMDPYLTLVDNAKDGKWSADSNGAFKSDHTYWKGFAARTAVGLKLEQRQP
ncbi:dienelactone hydrolase [Undibacterium sp. Jales W-56]|uniref:alpha/beta hydrolase family protein n=1 Tax=Undibacterium sp. Jales W-56 TaxID=2897325 RepID=UPI0021CFD841|nr:dienelactone hydrolase [Undibacterium sp. Jales W-56]MCU6433599.1 dienelactone hydrolase [Undibacterium sp. Jales W-56]